MIERMLHYSSPASPQNGGAVSIADLAGAPERMNSALPCHCGEREVLSRSPFGPNSEARGDKAGLLFFKRKDRDSIGRAADSIGRIRWRDRLRSQSEPTLS